MSEPMLPEDHPGRSGSAPVLPASPIDAVCDAALARLKDTLMPHVIVEDFPGKPDDYDFEGYAAAALVIYEGSSFGADGLRGEQGLSEEVRLTVVALVRSLRGNGGAYGLIRDIRQALHGVSLGGATGLRPISVKLDSVRDGVFQYQLDFAGRLPALPSKTAGVHVPRYR